MRTPRRAATPAVALRSGRSRARTSRLADHRRVAIPFLPSRGPGPRVPAAATVTEPLYSAYTYYSTTTTWWLARLRYGTTRSPMVHSPLLALIELYKTSSKPAGACRTAGRAARRVSGEDGARALIYIHASAAPDCPWTHSPARCGPRPRHRPQGPPVGTRAPHQLPSMRLYFHVIPLHLPSVQLYYYSTVIYLHAVSDPSISIHANPNRGTSLPGEPRPLLSCLGSTLDELGVGACSPPNGRTSTRSAIPY